MVRTVVSLFTNSDRVNFNLQLAPGNFSDARDLYEFRCVANDPPFQQMSEGTLKPDIVKCAGLRLFENLSTHPAVKNALGMALAMPDGVAPLYIHLNSERAEEFPWEALYSPEQSFLALDSRWPIARIADSSVGFPMIQRTLRAPLKIALILCAAGVDSTPEWNAFYNAIKKATFQLQILLFVCQEEIKTAIEALNDTRITVQYLPSKFDLLDTIQGFAPHILHFFCHGSTHGGPHLQLASRADWDGRDPRGSISIGPKDLLPFSCTKPGGDTWLVVLNCCLGGAPALNSDDDTTHVATKAEGTYSLARSLVTNAFPAVIGMREAITTHNAHTFCKAVYSSIILTLQEHERKGADKQFIELEWTKVLSRSRIHILDSNAGEEHSVEAAAFHKEWTLPLIYVRPELFMLRVHPANPTLNSDEIQALRTEIKTLRDHRQFFQTRTDFPPTILKDIDQRIVELTAKLDAHN